jgi:hypothetical protein
MTGRPDNQRQSGLLKDLKTIRRRRLPVRPGEVPTLRIVALQITSGDKRDEFLRIHEAIKLAAGRLDERSGQSLLHLLGVSRESDEMSTDERYGLAARRYGAERSHFERNIQAGLINELAEQLVALEAEGGARSLVDRDSEAVSSPADRHKRRVLSRADGPSQSPRRPAIVDRFKVFWGDSRRNRAAVVMVLVPVLCGATVLIIYGTRSPAAPPPAKPVASSARCLPANSSARSTGAALPASAAPVEIKLLHQLPTSKVWLDTLAPVQPASTVRFLLTYRNGSSAVQNQVVLRANLASRTLLVPDSACLYDVSHPQGLQMASNDVDQGGFDVGNFGAGASAYLLFSVAMPPTNDLECGETTIRTVGVARPEDKNEYDNTAETVVEKPC